MIYICYIYNIYFFVFCLNFLCGLYFSSVFTFEISNGGILPKQNLILWGSSIGDGIHRKYRSRSVFFVRSFTHRENEVGRNRVTTK